MSHPAPPRSPPNECWIWKPHQYFTMIVVTADWFPRLKSLVNWLASHSILNITIYLELWQLIKWHSAITPWCPELLEVCDKISVLSWNTLLRSTGDTMGSPLEMCDSEPGIAAWCLTHHSDNSLKTRWWCDVTVQCTELYWPGWFSLDCLPPPPSVRLAGLGPAGNCTLVAVAVFSPSPSHQPPATSHQ